MEEQKNKLKLDDLRVDSFVTFSETDLRTVRGASGAATCMAAGVCFDNTYDPGDTADVRFCG